jgi:hypothetical protein
VVSTSPNGTAQPPRIPKPPGGVTENTVRGAGSGRVTGHLVRMPRPSEEEALVGFPLGVRVGFGGVGVFCDSHMECVCLLERGGACRVCAGRLRGCPAGEPRTDRPGWKAGRWNPRFSKPGRTSRRAGARRRPVVARPGARQRGDPKADGRLLDRPDACGAPHGSGKRARITLRTGSVPSAASADYRCLLGARTPPWVQPPARMECPASTNRQPCAWLYGRGHPRHGRRNRRCLRRPTGQSRAGLGSKLPTPAQMSTVSLTAETPSFRSWDMIDESRQWSHVIRCRSSRASASGSDPPWTTPRRWVARVSAT